MLTVFLVARLGEPLLLTLDDAARPGVLYIPLSLGEKEFLRGCVQVLLPAVTLEDGLLGLLLEIILLGVEALVHELSLSWIGLHADIHTLVVCVPAEFLHLHHPRRLAAEPHKVVSRIVQVLWVRVLGRVVTHRARLWVVVRRIHIQVSQVFGGVLADSAKEIDSVV